MRPMRPTDITKFLLHCSANGPTSNIGVKEIRRYHTMPVSQGGRGWEEIGYHYVIKRDGTLEQGRSLAYQGAHCVACNPCSIGICLVGGVDNTGRPQDNFTRAQFDTLAALLRELRRSWPNASIHGHNEFDNKACPVFNVQDFLDRYGIAKDPNAVEWDAKRWPHFKPTEFKQLWPKGKPMPRIWKETLDCLEDIRADYGKPLVILKSSYVPAVNFTVDIKVPAEAQEQFMDIARENGCASEPAPGGVRIWREK